MNLQDTQREYERDADFLLEGHLQRPNDLLRKNEDDKVRGKVDCGRRDLEFGFLNASSFDSEIPDLFVRNARKAESEHRRHEERKLDADENDAEPPKDVTSPLRNEEARPFQ